MTICSHGKLVFNCGKCNDHPAQLPPPIRGEGRECAKRILETPAIFTSADGIIDMYDFDTVGDRACAHEAVRIALTRFALATPSSPEGSIMLEMAAADEAQQMWQRRWEALKQMYARERCFVDRDGQWGLRCFLDYVGQICGFEALAASPSSKENKS